MPTRKPCASACSGTATLEVAGTADVAVVNTCCVTHEAVSKSRQAVSRAARTHDRVYVTGCAANLGAAFERVAPNVTVVARPSEDVPDAVAGDVGAIGCVQADARLERTRAFVKIQDGCSFSCPFCVIPLVRGGTRSRRAGAVLAEIERRVAQGHREIVLTGVNLGCFRDREAGFTLPRLVREAGALPGVERLRLSSIEVNHLTDDLVAALRETDAASPHLHVPLQSGRRRRPPRDAKALLRRAVRREGSTRSRDFNLTADVIVGFPGEDEAAFERTLDVVVPRGITRVHVFPYSPRPGTDTAAAGHGAGLGEEGAKRAAACALGRALAPALGVEGRHDRSRPRRPARPRVRRTTTRRGSSTGEVGQLLDARAVGVSEEGILAVAA